MPAVNYEPLDAGIPPGRSGSDPLSDAIACALESLLAARDMSDANGEPVASVYIEGAAEALRTARDHLQPRPARLLLTEPGVTSLQGTTIGLRRRGGSMVADRGRLEESGGRFVFAPDPFADEERWPPSPDIGAALIADREAVSMCMLPWSASLLADALASSEWLHLASGEPCSPTRSAAAALVRAAGGGRRFPELAAGEAQGLVDARVAGLLKRLGWRRVRGLVVH